MVTLLILIVALVILTFMVMQLPQFGKAPSGKRLERIKLSPNYRNGRFQNLSPTPQLTEGYSMLKVLFNFFIKRVENRKPLRSIPFIKTDLKSLPVAKNFLIWFGHSSYLLRLEGKTFLVDPVLSGYASPFSRMNKAFNGASSYSADDLPFVDYLLITHDHYDHLDYETIKKLKGKAGTVVTALGVGEHFEKWGFPSSQIIEKDWWDNIALENGLTLHLTPARHFSGRKLQRNNTLWTSFVLQTPSKKFFIGGDSGYDNHFAEIGKWFGGFDLAILENGQYNEAWRYIHTLPEEVLKAGKELGAKRIFPVHSGKFDLGGHAWNEPLIRITELNHDSKFPLVTPLIGEVVDLDNIKQTFEEWWKD
jgi:L-ascorbate metabolism protein UlaG (beta-lactamase superfamily)